MSQERHVIIRGTRYVVVSVEQLRHRVRHWGLLHSGDGCCGRQHSTTPTPGPWTAHHDPDRGTFTVVDANGFGVAMHILDEANAHLIANAPRIAQEHAEMVNLIRWHLLRLIEQAYGKEHPCGDPARAALARIKGE